MTYVVNGADWDFSGKTKEYIEQSVGAFLDFIDLLDVREELVKIGDDFQSRMMLGESSLWEMFSAESEPELSGELKQELAAWLGPIQYYADDPDWPVGIEETSISIGAAAPVHNPDVAWVHHCLRGGIAAACINLGPPSIRNTQTALGTAQVHFVLGEESRRLFWRDVILIEGDSAESLARNAPRAYPDLYFVNGVLAHLDRLSGGYLASRTRVQAAFAILNDWGGWIFTCPPPVLTPFESTLGVATGTDPSNSVIETRFLGFGLTVAPEKPNVWEHRRSREARETVIENRRFYCHWHVKLQLHRNRIHIHPPAQESGWKVVVGMIDEHLPLPG